MNDVQYVKPREVFKHYKVTSTTLSRWAKEGKIDFVESPHGYRSYNMQSIADAFNNSEKIRTTNNSTSIPKISYCYCRVSTQGQKDDLNRQIEYMSSKFPKHKIISDIGSGINFKRKGLKTILESVINGDVEEVVVAYKDRLSRFGIELFEWLFSKFKVRFVVLNREIENRERELSEDLLSIITVFSARVNGSRKYGKKQRESKEESKEEFEKKE